MNDITTYTLTQEEIQQRYGHIKQLPKEMYIKPRYKELEPRMNFDRYKEMKEEGKTDRQIREEMKISWGTLSKWKYYWNAKGLYT